MDNFIVDTSSIWKNRKNGVSGVLRVKNEEAFIEACVESCISALDELIITYNDCTDNSEAEIEKIQKKYPDKIKVYKYTPNIIAFNLTEKEYNDIKNAPENSVHLFANYSNYALSKSSYKYVMKIDADQIYFTKQMEEICDAYRGKVTHKIGIKDWIAFIKILTALLLSKFFNVRLNINSANNFPGYKKVLYKLASKGVPVSLSGINVIYNDGWHVSMGMDENGVNILSPYNGVGDTVVFKVTPKVKFVPYTCEEYNKLISSKFSLIERLIGVGKSLPYGFIWIHMNRMRKGVYQKQLEYMEKYPQCFMPIEMFAKSSFKSLGFQIPESLLNNQMRYLFSILHDGDGNMVPIKYINTFGYSSSKVVTNLKQ